MKLCLLGLLTGCAGGPDIQGGRTGGAELSEGSLDVLFATEFPVASAAEALAQAAAAQQEGDIDKALFFYVRALQFQPDNVELLAHIGEIQMQRKNYVMAKRAFLAARNHDPTHARSHEGLGLIYMETGMHEKAAEELELAIENDDQLWRAHNGLGVYADKAGNFKVAQQHYDIALSINPAAAHVLNNRGYSKFLAGDDDSAVLDLYEAANQQKFPLAWANLGRVYAKKGLYDEAIATYRNVMSDAHAYNNTGYTAMQNGDFSQARYLLNEATRLSPVYFPDAEANLAFLEHSE